MEIKNYIVCLMLVSFMYLPVFCMKKSKNIKRQDSNFYISKDQEESKGSVVFKRLLAFIANQKQKEQRKKIIAIAADNIIECAINKASSSTEAISQELISIPVMGSVVSVPGVSSVTNFFFSKVVAPCLYDLNAAVEKKEEIKNGIKKNLTEKYLRVSKSKQLKQDYPCWFVSKMKSFASKKTEDKELYTEILCVAVNIAKENKQLFIDVLKAAKIREYLHTFLYEKITLNVKDIEDQIMKSYFDKENIK